MLAIFIGSLVFPLSLQASPEPNHANEGMLPPGTAFISIIATPGKIVVDLDSTAASLVRFSNLPATETERAELASLIRLWKTQSEIIQIEAEAECTFRPEMALITLEQPPANSRSNLARIEAVVTYECKKLEADREITLTLHNKIPAIKQLVVEITDLAGKTKKRTIEKSDFFPL